MHLLEYLQSTDKQHILVKRNIPSCPYGGLESEYEDQYYCSQSHIDALSEDEVGQAWCARTSHEVVAHNTCCSAAAVWRTITPWLSF